MENASQFSTLPINQYRKKRKTRRAGETRIIRRKSNVAEPVRLTSRRVAPALPVCRSRLVVFTRHSTGRAQLLFLPEPLQDSPEPIGQIVGIEAVEQVLDRQAQFGIALNHQAAAKEQGVRVFLAAGQE